MCFLWVTLNVKCPACREQVSMMAQICPHCRTVLSEDYNPGAHASSGGINVPIEFIHWIGWTFILFLLIGGITLAISNQIIDQYSDRFPTWLGVGEVLLCGFLSYKYREQLPYL
jgi:hypothetical protein